MERMGCEPGRVVISLQGRDEGRAFVVTGTIDEQHVWIADGVTRKLAHPKKKKIKHLRPKPYVVDLSPRPDTHRLMDSDLRKALEAIGLGIDQPLCKEG